LSRPSNWLIFFLFEVLERAMSSYTVATAKEHLSRVIDEALAGEPVTITRDGRPVAELRASKMVTEPKPMTQADIDRLRARRNERPPLGGDAVAIIREMREEGP
jgi:antitoxin (DNA-binding transcriptional repressor) of toxin-antitoxin stability system